METKLTRSIYDISPSFIRNCSASLFGLAKNQRRRSGDYGKWLENFNEKKNWSESRLREYQDQMLIQQVSEAFHNVPYYSELFKRLGLVAKDIRSVDDLPKLPILNKEDVIEAGSNLINTRFKEKDFNWSTTSGSTGTPLRVPRTTNIEQMEWAFLESRYLDDKVKGRPYSSFTGLELIPSSQTKPPFWVDNWANKQRMYSIFHMNPQNLAYYIESLNENYSYYFLGYPSAIYTISKYMLDNSIRLDSPPKYVFSGSEELQPHYEETIREAFDCKVMNRYGQNEFVGSITIRECGCLHYDMDYSILEFVSIGTTDDGLILAEIIATNMHDTAWPLLRYRTGDLVVYDPDEKCSSGCPGQVIRRIHGRTGMYFTLPDGSRVTNISVIAKKCTNVKLIQVCQKELGSLEIHVVKDEQYSINDEKNMLEQFRRKIGNKIEMKIVYVNDIKRTRSGKYISIINQVDSQVEDLELIDHRAEYKL